jgi:hypothetical protein
MLFSSESATLFTVKSDSSITSSIRADDTYYDQGSDEFCSSRVITAQCSIRAPHFVSVRTFSMQAFDSTKKVP